MEVNMKRFVAVIMVVLFAAICVVCGYILGSEGYLSKGSASAPIYKSIDEVKQTINRYYYEDVTEEKLEEGILKGMAGILEDQYSMYMTHEEYETYKDNSSGSYGGVGVLLGFDPDNTKQTIVKEVYEGSSAFEEGLKIGDIFVSIDGIDVTDISSLSDVSNKLKGDEGTTVQVKIKRGTEFVDFTLERRQIKIKYVESRLLEDGVGYIHLKEFSGDCSQDFADALNKLNEEGAKGFIVDLRGNPGGYVRDAVAIADMLQPKGIIVYTEDKNGKRDTYTADDKWIDRPLVLLMNGNSASASEILAGALQDHKVAEIVGEKSFGKGIVQKPYVINSTGGALMLTISTYYTPNGRSIHGEGLHPDYEVQQPKEVLEDPTKLTDENDAQLKKAVEVLKGKISSAGSMDTAA